MSDFFFLSAAVLSATSLLYHIRFALSSGFFKVFLNFFQPLGFVNLAWSGACQRPFHYTTSIRSCQEVFKNFFQVFQSSLSISSLLRRLVDSSVIISYTSPAVNTFFTSFCRFSLCYKKQCTISIFVHRFAWQYIQAAHRHPVFPHSFRHLQPFLLHNNIKVYYQPVHQTIHQKTLLWQYRIHRQ